MPGKNGKRAGVPKYCIKCHRKINASVFMRGPKGDEHIPNPDGSPSCSKQKRHDELEAENA
jgi:hypothetical protein